MFLGRRQKGAPKDDRDRSPDYAPENPPSSIFRIFHYEPCGGPVSKGRGCGKTENDLSVRSKQEQSAQKECVQDVRKEGWCEERTGIFVFRGIMRQIVSPEC